MNRVCSKCHTSKELATNYYHYKRGRGGYQAQCKVCMRLYKIDKFIPRKQVDRIREQGFRIVYCPDGIFSKGAEFSRHDFLVSLAGGAWPNNMIVEDIETRINWKVRGTTLVETEE